jgi:hypothetical protein
LEEHMKMTKAELIENIEILTEKCEKLIKERDEARREVCERKWMEHSFDILKYARMRGWDCFKEEDK